MADWALVTVKFLHVLSAVVWLGGTVWSAALGRAAGAQAEAGTIRRVRVWLHASGGSAVLFGLELARQEFGSLNPFAWPDVSPFEGGPVLTAFFVALAAFAVQAWTLRRAESLSQASVGLSVVAALLAVVLFLMIVAGLGGF